MQWTLGQTTRRHLHQRAGGSAGKIGTSMGLRHVSDSVPAAHGLGDGGDVAGWDPPEAVAGLVHLFEPLRNTLA